MENKIAMLGVEIQIDNWHFRCSTERTKKANLAEAWKMLVIQFQKDNIKIPQSKNSFLQRQGKLRYFRSW